MTDPLKPLAPLPPALTATLGPAEPRTFIRPDGLDIQIAGWRIGLGQIGVPGKGSSRSQRGVDVEIFVTEQGRLVTTRNAWTRAPDGGSHHSQTSQVHETPAAAYQWLLDDGKGKLGPASKAAWVQACQTLAPMSGLEVERIG